VISREKMLALYSAMVKYRLLATQAQENLPKAWALTPGLEATVAAITADLRRDDSFLATESKLASTFVPRISWKGLIETATSARAGKSRTSGATVEKQLAAAVASAQALKAAKSDAVALAFCESRLKAGFWREQLQRTSRGNLPLVLVRLARDSRRAHVAPAAFVFGVPRIAVDAADVRAVYRVAGESIARARHRRGPTLIECLQAPQGASPDAADPIRAMELALIRKRILNAALKEKIQAAAQREVKRNIHRLLALT